MTNPATETSDIPSPETWQTGDEPATPRQQAYVERLARDSGVDVPEDLTKAQASEAIDEMQENAPS